MHQEVKELKTPAQLRKFIRVSKGRIAEWEEELYYAESSIDQTEQMIVEAKNKLKKLTKKKS